MPHTTITDLPKDVLSCIVRHLQHDAWQDQTLADIAALRSVCRSLRHAVDVTVTHARFHPYTDIEALRNVTSRCKGDCCHPASSVPVLAAISNQAEHQHLNTPHLQPTQGCSSWGLNALLLYGPTGLEAVKLQQLHPYDHPATLDALMTLQHLRSLDMP